MNENIDLTKILKDCPKGFKLYSLIHGEVAFSAIKKNAFYQIEVKTNKGALGYFLSNGRLYKNMGECILLPSKDQIDWNKFSAPWYNNGKFDPKTLQPFDKVLVSVDGEWQCDFFSHMLNGDIFNKRCIGVGDMNIVIPYNNDTKNLIGTNKEAPEFYRYWEN